MTRYLRPDEQVTEGEIKKSQGRTDAIKTALGTAGSLGAASFAVKAFPKILPFLSEYIPEDLAYKGINKVMPGLGNFLRSGMKQGLSLKSGLEFIKKEFTDEISKPQGKKTELNQTSSSYPKDERFSPQQPAKSNKNIIEQESPELHQFLDQEIRKGRQPIEAAALAQNDKRFSSIINKLTKIHKTPWSQIIQSIFGNGQTALANPQQGMQQQAQQMQQGQQQQMQSQPQGQGGQGQQALMAILNKINQRMGQ